MTSRRPSRPRPPPPNDRPPGWPYDWDALTGLPGGVRRTVLKGGLRVVTEQMPGVRSAAVGVFVQVGSRDEAAQLNGASHFLEHLLFKGTPTRSAMDISAALDEVGGEFNAYTAREYTCYHARVLDEDLPTAIDVLGDMVTSSLITSEDLEAERDVILDEIAMHDDDPDDVVHNLFAATAWAGTPLARPIAGTTESIKALTRAQVKGYYRRRYRPEVMTLAVAGNVDHADVVRRTRKAFSRGGFLDGDAAPAGPRVAERPRPLRSGEVSAARPFEQVNVVLGMQGLTRSDPRRYVLSVLNAALGGGSSSRLFQEVRERRGLAYSVYSFGLGYSDAGMVGVAAGSSAQQGRRPAARRTVRAHPGRGVRLLRGGGRARQGPGPWRARAQPRGQRLPDEPARRGRAVPAPAAVGGRRPRAPRRGERPTTCTRWRVSSSRGRRPSRPWGPAAVRLSAVSALKVGVLGALGKVGRAVCDAVEEAARTDGDVELVARIDADDDLQGLVDAGRRGRRRLHPPRRGDGQPRVLRLARHPCRGRHHRLRRRPARHAARLAGASTRARGCWSHPTSPSARC